MKKFIALLGISSFLITSLFAQNAKEPTLLKQNKPGKYVTGDLKSASAPEILYFCDYIMGTDEMLNSFLDLPPGSNYTIADNSAEFAALLLSNPYDLAILFIQGNFSEYYEDAIYALSDYVNNGGSGIYYDWSGNNTYAALFGFTYTGNINNTEITVLPPLSEGLSVNPIDVVNPDWGIFSTGMQTTDGIVLATFSDGEAAIIMTIEGRMLVYGFANDAVELPEIFNQGFGLIFSVPEDVYLCSFGGEVYFLAPDTAETFQWQSSSDGGTVFEDLTDGGIFSGTTTDSLVINPAGDSLNGYMFRAILNRDSIDEDTSLVAKIILETNPPIWDLETEYEEFLCTGNSAGFTFPAPYDYCGIDSIWHDSEYGISETDPSGIYPVGLTTVNYYAEDLAGNPVSGSFDVYVVPETTDPSWNIDIEYEQITCDSTELVISIPAPEDNCGIDSIWHDSPYGISETDPSGNYPVGTTVVNYYVEDINGNSISGWFTVVNLIETESPDWDLETTYVLYSCDSLEADLEIPAPTDNCEIDSIWHDSPYGISETDPGGNYPINDTTTVNYYVVDVNGNELTGTFDVIVTYDTLPPVWVNPEKELTNYSSTNQGKPTFQVRSGGVLYGRPNAGGSCCSGSNPQADLMMFSPTVSGTHTITSTYDYDGYMLLYTDPHDLTVLPPVTIVAGNDDYGSIRTSRVTPNLIAGQTYYLYNTAFSNGAGPFITTFSSPVHMSLEIVLPSCTDSAYLSLEPPTDNCGIDSIWHNSPYGISETDPSGYYPLGTTVVSYYVKDNHNNEISGSFNVNVVFEMNPPAWDVHDTTIITCGEGVNVEFPDYTDDCGINNAVFYNHYYMEYVTDPSGEYPLGRTELYYYIEDINGNILENSIFINVVSDHLDPVMLCPENITVSVDPGTDIYTIQGTGLDPVITDDCEFTLVNNINSSSSLDGVELQGGINIIEWTATDGMGNINSCSFTVTVPDVDALSLNEALKVSLYPKPLKW